MQFYNVKSVEETFSIINQNVTPHGATVTLPLHQARGFVLAEDIIAPEDVPGFDRATVDGYAVKAQDTYGSSESNPQFLEVVGEIEMGEEVTQVLEKGQAMAIPTGGMLPPGSDSVIMMEYCENLDGLLNTYRQVAPQENVIQKGEDVQKGAQLLAKGTRLRAQELGVLASLGITEVTVYRPVRVGYFSSGDEIVSYQTQELKVGQVRDINQLTISALIEEWGGEVMFGGIVPDDEEQLKQTVHRLYEQVDFLVMSGGSSIGAKDYMTAVIQSLGDPGVLVHGVSIKPGKPTIFSMAGKKPVLGLPGQPASAMLIFLLFGQTVMRRLQGEAERSLPRRIEARITQNIASSPGRADYIRVRLVKKEGEWWAEPILGKSGLISTLVASDGLVEIASGKEGVRQGERVPVIMLR
ncbi:molybdopterin molybdenumtransferase MoeA [Caldalkalibacillus thermarum]|uniref:molybdopterin molybdotransferase MoeA n=1 Tax=Caldalkalibacillus thermarum TaxID=296745 RepID=UPI001665AC23|nr:gephyrin-like molybdotransferase Glp [Caldalkalibacillus thermarum]GGK20566.1 molybdopterin molybdenumtransferase MoeA [Caldalkalibacillus thermarum]